MEIISVFDPSHELVMSGRLSELHDLRAGRIRCDLNLGHGNLEALADGVLRGLGKRSLGRDLQRNAGLKWILTRAWCEGEAITDFFLTNAESLLGRTPYELQSLPEHSRLWLIYAEPRAERWIAKLDATPITTDVFRERWSSVAANAAEQPPPPYPTVPAEDFARFRIRSYRELPREDFKIVNRTWRTAYRTCVAWQADSQPLTEEGISERLRTMISSCGDYQESVVVIRAAQAALLQAGYLMKLLMSRYAQGAQLASPADIERGIADRLRWYTSSARAAAGVIRVLAQAATLDEIADIAVDDVSSDGTAVTVGGRQIEIPTLAAGILRSQHAAHRLLGSPSSQFLVYTRGRQIRTVTSHVVSRWFRETTAEAGVSIAGPTSRRARIDAPGWVSRRGLTIRPLFPSGGSGA